MIHDLEKWVATGALIAIVVFGVMYFEQLGRVGSH